MMESFTIKCCNVDGFPNNHLTIHIFYACSTFAHFLARVNGKILTPHPPKLKQHSFLAVDFIPHWSTSLCTKVSPEHFPLTVV